jgi:hypothetical protein
MIDLICKFCGSSLIHVKRNKKFCSKYCMADFQNLEARKNRNDLFWSKVDITDSKSCWEWKGSLSNVGYGSFRFCDHNRNYSISTHRYSFEYFFLNIPKGLNVLHECDNRKCVNPNHLWAGTQSDNRLDCIQKGRYHYGLGEDSNNFKLNEYQVRFILFYKFLYSQSLLAKMFRVTPGCVQAIVERRSWKHLEV